MSPRRRDRVLHSLSLAQTNLESGRRSATDGARLDAIVRAVERLAEAIQISVEETPSEKMKSAKPAREGEKLK